MCKEKIYSISDKTIKVSGTQKIKIVLPGYGATGYSWDVASKVGELKVLEKGMQSSSGTPDKETNQMNFGQSLDEYFIIEVSPDQGASIDFILSTPWNSEVVEHHYVKIMSEEE